MRIRWPQFRSDDVRFLLLFARFVRYASLIRTFIINRQRVLSAPLFVDDDATTRLRHTRDVRGNRVFGELFILSNSVVTHASSSSLSCENAISR